MAKSETWITALIVAVVTSVATGVTNFAVSKILFTNEREARKLEKSEEMVSQVVFHFHKAAHRKSYINSNDVEYHMYDLLVTLNANESDPSVQSMRQAQQLLNRDNAAHFQALNDHKSDYSRLISLMSGWIEDGSCADALVETSEGHLAKSVTQDPIFRTTADEFYKAKMTPYDAILHLKENHFSDHLDFSSEIGAFETAVRSCYSELIIES